MKSGYSGTPLEKKLGLKEEHVCALFKAPKNYRSWFDRLELLHEVKSMETEENLDFAHAFCTTRDDLEKAISSLQPRLKQNGMLWISWPKGSSKIATELKREPIRDFVLANGLVDVKVAAIDNDWSGLKFVYRLKDRK